MKQKWFGVCIIMLVLAMSAGAWAQTVCDETSPDFFSDYTSGVHVGRIHDWANLLQEIPITIENLEFGLPIPEDFCLPLDSGLLDILEPFIVGTHTFDFSLSTSAELVDEVNYAVTADPGLVTIDIDMGLPGGAPYLEADVSFGNIVSDCDGTGLGWPVCMITAGIFNLLIENSSVYFRIDTIHVTQEIDTCITQEDGKCLAEAEVASTAATQTGFWVDTEFGSFMDDIISAITSGMIADFIKMVFTLEVPEEGSCLDTTSVTTLVLLLPFITTQADGCSPPPELAACRSANSGCSTASQKVVLRQSSRGAASVALYMLPAVVLFGLIIWRRKK